MIITQRQEMLLSYLTGLPPMGEPISCTGKMAEHDLGYRARQYYHDDFKRLLDIEAVSIIESRLGSRPCTMRVLKRPEAFEVKA